MMNPNHLLIIWTADEKVAETYTHAEANMIARRVAKMAKRYGVVVLPPGWAGTMFNMEPDDVMIAEMQDGQPTDLDDDRTT